MAGCGGSVSAGIRERGAHHIDVHVGGRIRLRRKALGITQERLAQHLGLTFQQVQKYERGANRVSASKLYEIARTLRTPIASFFEGLPDPVLQDESTDPVEADINLFLATDEGIDLSRLFPRITEAKVRRQMLSLVRVLVDRGD